MRAVAEEDNKIDIYAVSIQRLDEDPILSLTLSRGQLSATFR